MVETQLFHDHTHFFSVKYYVLDLRFCSLDKHWKAAMGKQFKVSLKAMASSVLSNIGEVGLAHTKKREEKEKPQ